MINDFSIIFISIFLEAIPFILIGLIISAIIQVFVAEETLQKIIPKNLFLGLITASLMGIIFPVCECAIIPIARKLIQKGLPLPLGITFMLAVPIANPIVLLSTYFAFAGNLYFVFYRALLGILVSIVIGLIVHLIYKNSDQLINTPVQEQSACCHCSHEDIASSKHSGNFQKVVDHIILEFFDVGRFLIFGALIAAFAQVIIPRESILIVGNNNVLSIITMMSTAYVIALCSEADAFVARAFLNIFTNPSIMAFLILGPMIDVKNTFIMLSTFKKRFVVVLILLIFSGCFIATYLLEVFKI